ncbi:MAG TPA: penicillin-binding protein 2 [Gemmatimonadaceae bacterium]|nr:penicillin-binding protein 2 [Gemmatimonadaceae bacterium]
MVRLSRVSVIHLVLVIFAIALVGQAAKVQLVQGKSWADRARRQQYQQGALTAARGVITDASGTVLAESRELLRIAVDLRAIPDRNQVIRALRKAGVASVTLRQVQDPNRKWVELPGLHVPSEVADILAIPGVTGQPVLSREYSGNPGLRRIVGSVSADGRAADGIELAMDAMLRGDTARGTFARDSRGQRLDSPEEWAAPPRAGHNVTLTINRDLQEICERALAGATDSLRASGGDIVVMNPRTGEILAMASRRAGKRAFANTAVTEPFEPGSTLKPFIAAALLARKRARPDEIIETFNGEMVINGRTIVDLHKAPRLSLAEVIRFSSNIGIVRFAERLTPRERYETLRDVGLGTPTGVPLPAEADGTLREPARWNRSSAASMAMGYELAVTPLQLVTAYSAIANGGELMEPHLIKEIRTAEGDLLYAARRRVVRRFVSREVARSIQRMLIGVVDSGTAVKADLATFHVAGKSGTARRTVEGRGYVAGNYTASFVGLFPGDKPQYVVLVKLDSPQGAYYGGEIAAPVTAVVLRAALAARDAALDREALTDVERANAGLSANGSAESANVTEVSDGGTSPGTNGLSATLAGTPMPPKTVPLPFAAKPAIVDQSMRAVPDVGGMGLRDAVRALHRAGFRVRLVNRQGTLTVPVAGSLHPGGAIVKLLRGR